jgi:hypothetical protein
MKVYTHWVGRLCLALLVWTLVASPFVDASTEEPALVGHIVLVDGALLRYVPDAKDWVATVKDAPFGLNDALYSDENAKAEIVMPNRTWLRIGASTQVQLLTLTPDVTEIDVASGVARFYNNSSDALVKATTPFGYAVAQPGSSFDLYVGDQAAEVIALEGSVEFVHADSTKYEVIPGASSVIADESRVEAGDANVDADWDDWNVERDSVWETRMEARRDSGKYLPPELQDESYELEENGTWERVDEEGQERYLWRPTRIGPWAPFTAGRWTEYYGDQCWVPDEPFGYVTHHYGNWVFVRNRWYWAPPVARGGVGPGAAVGLNWYPGRVAWIGSGVEVGWILLAPNEPYNAHRLWGPAARVVGTAPGAGLTLGNLVYVQHAVIVPQSRFYSVSNYSHVRITNINQTTIINNYRVEPVVNDTILKDYSKMPNKHHFTNVKVTNKPHQGVLTRIEHNRGVAEQQASGVNVRAIKQHLNQAKPAALPARAKVSSPKVTSKIVPEAQVNKPESEVRFSPKDVKLKPRDVRATPGGVGAKPTMREPPRPRVSEPPSAEPKKEVPVKSVERPPAAERGKRGISEPAAEPRPISPTRPAESVRPGDHTPRGEPAKPPAEQREAPAEAGTKAPSVAPHHRDQRKPARPPDAEETQRVIPETGASELKPEKRKSEPPGRGQEDHPKQPKVHPQAPQHPGVQISPPPREKHQQDIDKQKPKRERQEQQP